MSKLTALDSKLLRAAALAALRMDGDAPADDEKDPAADGEDDTTDQPPVPASRKGKKAGKPKGKKAEDPPADDETADDGEDPEDQTADDGEEDPEAEDDQTDQGADDGEDPEDQTADDGEEDPATPPASKKSKAAYERARIAAITRHSASAGREDLAEYLAFETGLSAKSAVGILRHAPKAKTSISLRSRMAGIENPRIKSGSGKAASEDDEAIAALTAAARLVGLAPPVSK